MKKNSDPGIKNIIIFETSIVLRMQLQVIIFLLVDNEYPLQVIKLDCDEFANESNQIIDNVTVFSLYNYLSFINLSKNNLEINS